MPADSRVSFLEALSEWLPNCAFKLLYRGSRDGMSPDAFHAACDGKGATLTLIRANGYTFGGYASGGWESHHPVQTKRCESVFLFSVLGPFSNTAIEFSPRYGAEGMILCGDAAGPCFSNGIYIGTRGGPAGTYDNLCASFIGDGYRDELLKGPEGLAGTRNFTPSDIEVFRVIDLDEE